LKHLNVVVPNLIECLLRFQNEYNHFLSGISSHCGQDDHEDFTLELWQLNIAKIQNYVENQINLEKDTFQSGCFDYEIIGCNKFCNRKWRSYAVCCPLFYEGTLMDIQQRIKKDDSRKHWMNVFQVSTEFTTTWKGNRSDSQIIDGMHTLFSIERCFSRTIILVSCQ